MVIYAIIMVLIGLLFFVIGYMINNGRTDLIHSYHQNNIKQEDKEKYGKEFSKGIIGLATSSMISGLLSLLKISTSISIGILIIGTIISIIQIVKVQNHFNKGIF